MWIYYILNVVNLLYVLVTVCDHLQVDVNTGDLWKVAINLYMPEYPLCHCDVSCLEDSSQMFAVWHCPGFLSVLSQVEVLVLTQDMVTFLVIITV